MLIDMAIFSLMAMRYKYVEKKDDDSVNEGNGNDVDLVPQKRNGIDNASFIKDES